MANPLTLARAWRILKEVDLDAIRREAEAPLRIVVIGETDADADDLAVLLAGGDAHAAQWIAAMDAPLAAEQARPAGAGAPVVDGPDIVIAVTRGAQASPVMSSVQAAWRDRKVPLVVAALDSGEQPGSVRTQGLVARVAIRGLNVQALSSIAEALSSIVRPDQRVALARELPGLRPCMVDQLISETARANAGYSFGTGLAEIVPILGVPMNIGDMIVLTKNQLVMAYRIALAAGKQGRPRDLIGEILGVLGGGLLFRQLARQLVGMVPVIGIVPKVAVAYGGTWAIGRAVTLWATEGQTLTAERLKALSREGLARGRGVARAMKRKTPAA